MTNSPVQYCRFCGCSQYDTETLVSAGPGEVAICTECVELAMLIVLDKRNEKREAIKAARKHTDMGLDNNGG